MLFKRRQTRCLLAGLLAGILDGLHYVLLGVELFDDFEHILHPFFVTWQHFELKSQFFPFAM